MTKMRYKTSGTCCTEILIELDGDVIRDVKFADGCTGNLQALAALVKGRSAGDVAALLENIQCRNGTSCPDQLARALRQHGQAGSKSRTTKKSGSKKAGRSKGDHA